MKIWIISDSHTFHRELKVPEADMVIHCGDATNSGDLGKNLSEFGFFKQWFENLSIKHKVFVPGNHDLACERFITLSSECDFMVLIHQFIEIEGLRIFGSPYTPKFGNWAFNVERKNLSRYWEQIPECDILTTHGPAKSYLDLTDDFDSGKPIQVGCTALRNRLNSLTPMLHCFGHIHCLKEGSEILTTEGWKDIDSIAKTHRAVNYDIERGVLALDQILNVYKDDFKGWMMYSKGTSHDFAVTYNHEILDFSKEKPRKLYSHSLLTEKVSIKVNGYLKRADYAISDNDIRLMVQCAADGSWDHNAWRFHLKKERKIQRLKNLLEDMDIPYSCYLQKTGKTKIRFKWGVLEDAKPLPFFVTKFSTRQIDILFSEYYLTDGYQSKPEYPSYQISTAKKSEADILQHLAVVSGRRCSISIKIEKKKEYYILSINENSAPINISLETSKMEHYDGRVFCIRTKNKTVISRYNGKVMISGNSNPSKNFYNTGAIFDRFWRINASCCCDGVMKLTSNGFLFDTETKTLEAICR